MKNDNGFDRHCKVVTKAPYFTVIKPHLNEKKLQEKCTSKC